MKDLKTLFLSLEKREGQDADFSMEERIKQAEKHQKDTRPPTHSYFKVLIPGIKSNTFSHSVR